MNPTRQTQILAAIAAATASATKREDILAEIYATISLIPGITCWRSRAEALIRDECPAVVVAPGRDSPTVPRVSTCYIDWSMVVQVAVNTRGSIPDQLADPILSAIHASLMIDQSLGGLVIEIMPGNLSWQLDKADLTSCWAVQDWMVRYRTAPALLD